ncbi:hypothetical protein IJT17_06415 [bacterium]|nr:hypothetical protein [bacterium]
MPRDSASKSSSPEPAGVQAVAQSEASSETAPDPTAELTVANNNAVTASSLSAVYADKAVGDRFEFGRYPQGANGEVKPIIWRVLERDSDHLLMISEQCLDCKPYNDDMCAITWENCSLRNWLNSYFYNKAFSEQERECILQTRNVNTDNNVEPDTEDRIFLLSIGEAKKLFVNDRDRCAKPTECAAKNGVYTVDSYGCWWLRSCGYDDNLAACVYPRGVVGASGRYVSLKDLAVRPAFKIAL